MPLRAKPIRQTPRKSGAFHVRGTRLQRWHAAGTMETGISHPRREDCRRTAARGERIMSESAEAIVLAIVLAPWIFVAAVLVAAVVHGTSAGRTTAGESRGGRAGLRREGDVAGV
jgi:hypothetical protein